MPTPGAARRRAKQSYVLACRKEVYQVVQQKAVPPLMPERLEAVIERRSPYKYRLVQRLERGTRWLGGKFELDYMGSAEYEFGASRRSLKRMRDSGDLVLKPVTASITVLQGSVTRTVYFVGSQNGLDDKIVDFRSWLEAGCRSTENTEFDEIFGRTDRYRKSAEWFDRTIAWWSFDDDVMFSLREDVARELLYGLDHPAT